MNVSPDALRKATVEVLKEVDLSLQRSRVHDPQPDPVLLLAKAQCLNTLALLNV